MPCSTPSLDVRFAFLRNGANLMEIISAYKFLCVFGLRRLTLRPGACSWRSIGSADQRTNYKAKMNMNCNMSMPMNCSMNMNMGPMKMQMYFYFGDDNVTVLFEDWNINSIGAMVGSCIAIFLMAVLYEGLKVFREIVQQRKVKFYAKQLWNGFCSIWNRASSCKFKKTTKISSSPAYGTNEKTPLMSSPGPLSFLRVHIIQTILHMLQVTISYFLMLIVMTYNAWLFIAVILGAGTGYFLFARFRESGNRSTSLQDENEHCH